MTPLAAALAVPLMLLAWLGIALGQGYVVRDHAQSTADLAALATVEAAGSCAAAERVVGANAAHSLSPRMVLTGCSWDGGDARIVVQAELPVTARQMLAWLSLVPGVVEARAMAGPLTYAVGN